MKTDMWSKPRDLQHGCYVRFRVGPKRFAHADFTIANSPFEAAMTAALSDMKEEK